MLLKFNHHKVVSNDYTISLAISDDGYGDYSIMLLVESNNTRRLFNRLIIEDYTNGDIVSL